MKLKSGVLTLLGVLLAVFYGQTAHGQTVQGQTGNVIHYTTTIDNVKYLFATARWRI